jgi:hypothetical protein
VSTSHRCFFSSDRCTDLAVFFFALQSSPFFFSFRVVFFSQQRGVFVFGFAWDSGSSQRRRQQREEVFLFSIK